MEIRRPSESLTTLVLILALPGCGTLRNGHGWGEDALLPPPGLERVGRSALRAAINPMTWVPALGAGVFALGRLDREVSDWAIERTPVYGSQPTASAASDYLMWITMGAAGITALATPSGEDFGEWLIAKGKGLVIEGLGVGATAGVTGVLKGAVDRNRPTGSNGSSFPSGHAAASFSFATHASKNLDSILLPSGLRMGLQAGVYTAAGAAAWARVEAGNHFPSDVLAGAAIGHFLTAFIHDAFLGLPLPESLSLEVEPFREGAMVWVGFSF